MAPKIKILLGCLPILLLVGCGKSSQQIATSDNVMQLVNTGSGDIKSTDKSNKELMANPQLYNANTASVTETKKTDWNKVVSRPKNYLPFDEASTTKGKNIIIGNQSTPTNKTNSNKTTQKNTTVTNGTKKK